MRILATMILGPLLAGAVQAAAQGGEVGGTASYRERIALPPGAVFEVVLEDVSVADAPAVELGRSTLEEPGSPPFEFEIDYDPDAIDDSHTYSLRAQVSVGRRLIFVSDTMNPVLTNGAPSDDVQIWMIKVGDTAEEAREAPTTIGAHGLRLPASFAGDLPCADCEGVRYRLNLWPDQVFHMRRVWIGKDVRRDTIGRWTVDADRHVLTLRSDEEQQQFQILGPARLLPLGRDGTPLGSDLDHSFSALDRVDSIEPHLPLRGMLTYEADAARFTECLTGRDYALAEEGDYAALEHAYLAAGAEPGGPIMASFDGGIVQRPSADGSGAEPEVLVERFVGVWPGETCERAMGTASLTNTYWKILRLGETEVAPGEGRREPNLILREGEEPRVTATVGCNQLTGRYALTEDKLSFGPVASTQMACPKPLDAWEKQLGSVLERATSWRIDGQTLELLDPAGNPLALFQAVYLY